MIDKGIARAIDVATAKHYVNAPSHGAGMLQQLKGEIDALSLSTEDDPLLYAYLIHDRIGRIAGLVVAIEKWTTAVIDATPEQLVHTGAQLCR